MLARGYAIASNEQGLVTKAEKARPGEDLHLKFMDGSLSCRVISRESAMLSLSKPSIEMEKTMPKRTFEAL